MQRSRCFVVGSFVAAFALVPLSRWASGAEPAERRAAPTLATPQGDVAIFPADNPWNQPIDRLPVHPRSEQFIRSIGPDKPLHPDFGTEWNGAPSGIPYCLAGKDQKPVAVEFQYAEESDPGPYPIPAAHRLKAGRSRMAIGTCW